MSGFPSPEFNRAAGRDESAVGPRATAMFGLCALAGLASALELVATTHGPGLAWDSVSYLSIGVNIARGQGVSGLSGNAVTLFPPGLPLVAAVGGAIGVGPQLAVRVFNAVCAALIVVIGHKLLDSAMLRNNVLWGATALLSFSPILLSLNKMALTEPAFTVMVGLLLLEMQRIWHTRQLNPADALSITVICSVAFLLRYVGLVLIAATVLGLMVALPRTRTIAVRVGGVVGAALVVPSAWMARNFVTDGTLLGNRPRSTDSFSDVIASSVSTLAQWTLPVSGAPRTVSALFLLVLTLAAGFLHTHNLLDHGGSGLARRTANLGPAILFCVVYVTFIVFAQLTITFNRLDSRLLSPIYLPAFLLATVAVSGALDWADSVKRKRLASGFLVAMLSFFGLVQIVGTGQQIRQGLSIGIGYNSDRWRQSETARAARHLVESESWLVFSNQYPGLWAATGHQPIMAIPRFADPRDSDPPIDDPLARFADEVNCSKHRVMLVMFNDGETYSYPIATIGEVVDIAEIADLADGSVFEAKAINACIT